MEEKTSLALRSAEENYLYYTSLKPLGCTSKPAEHIIALNALFESFFYYEVAVTEAASLICALDEESGLFCTLIEPHRRVLDDIALIAREYTKMYIKYVAKITEGFESKSAIENLFA